MTELKLEPATEGTKPVEKVVEPVKNPPVQVPPAQDKNTVKPVEASKADEKVAPVV